MDDLARELGISKKTLYFHFRSKDEIVHEVVFELAREVRSKVEQIVSRDTSFIEKLNAIFLLLFEIFSQFGTEFPKDMARGAPELWEELDAYRTKYVFSKFLELFRQAQEEGLLREDVNIPLLQMILTSLLQNMVTPQMLIRLPYDGPTTVRVILSMLLEGILSETGRQKLLSENTLRTA